MTGRRNGRVYECVLVDVNTQRDFCDADGACPVANIAALIPALRHTIAWVKRNQAPIISSVESHRPTDLSDSGYPLVCLDGSGGQRKIGFTVLTQRTWVESDNTLSCPTDLFQQYQQVIFRKRSDDLLANPKADRFFSQLPTQLFIVFGVSLEGSVKALALSLLARAKPVSVIVDASGYWNEATADLAIRQITAKGARIMVVDELLKLRLDRRRRYPTRRRPYLPFDFADRLNGNHDRTASDRSDPARPRSGGESRRPSTSPTPRKTRDADT